MLRAPASEATNLVHSPIVQELARAVRAFLRFFLFRWCCCGVGVVVVLVLVLVLVLVVVVVLCADLYWCLGWQHLHLPVCCVFGVGVELMTHPARRLLSRSRHCCRTPFNHHPL